MVRNKALQIIGWGVHTSLNQRDSHTTTSPPIEMSEGGDFLTILKKGLTYKGKRDRHSFFKHLLVPYP